jgi:hypothetical protein
MHGNVSERFFGYPDLISIIVGPSSDRKRLPAFLHSRRSPDFPYFALVFNPFPLSGLIQIVCFVFELGRQPFYRLAFDLNSFSQSCVTGSVPVVPLSVQFALSVRHLSRVGQYRRAAGCDLIPGVASLLEIINPPAQGEDFD